MVPTLASRSPSPPPAHAITGQVHQLSQRVEALSSLPERLRSIEEMLSKLTGASSAAAGPEASPPPARHAPSPARQESMQLDEWRGVSRRATGLHADGSMDWLLPATDSWLKGDRRTDSPESAPAFGATVERRTDQGIMPIRKPEPPLKSDNKPMGWLKPIGGWLGMGGQTPRAATERGGRAEPRGRPPLRGVKATAALPTAATLHETRQHQAPPGAGGRTSLAEELRADSAAAQPTHDSPPSMRRKTHSGSLLTRLTERSTELERSTARETAGRTSPEVAQEASYLPQALPASVSSGATTEAGCSPNAAAGVGGSAPAGEAALGAAAPSQSPPPQSPPPRSPPRAAARAVLPASAAASNLALGRMMGRGTRESDAPQRHRPANRSSGGGGNMTKRARRTSFNLAAFGVFRGRGTGGGSGFVDSDDAPPTLEDFVSEVSRRGAVEDKRVEQRLEWELRSKWRRCYPLLYPHTTTKSVWDWLVSLTVLLSVILYPMLLGFSHVLASWLHPTLLLLDGVYWLDILLSFATAVLPRNTEEPLITRPLDIAYHYAATYLLVDLVAGVPYYYLSCSGIQDCCVPHPQWEMSPGFTLVVALRLTRISRSETARVLLLLPPQGPNDHPSAAKNAKRVGRFVLMRLALLFFWLSHAAGCLYWYVSVLALRDGAKTGVLAWGKGAEFLPSASYASYLSPYVPEVRRLINTTSLEPWQAGSGAMPWQAAVPRHFYEYYIFSLTWGLTHASGVSFTKHEEPRETMCVLVVSLIAIATNAVLIGSVTTTLTRLNAYESEESKAREAITGFLASQSVPRVLQERIHQYYDFRGGVTRTKKLLLPSLPKGLSFELEIFLKRAIFVRVPFFHGLPARSVMALVPLVSSEPMMPGRIFVREGLKMDGMYFILKGRALLLVQDHLVAVRFAGEIIGEESLLRDRVAQWTCMAGDWCELMRLKGADFRVLAQTYPDLLKRVESHEREKRERRTDGAGAHLVARHHEIRLQQEGWTVDGDGAVDGHCHKSGCNAIMDTIVRAKSGRTRDVKVSGLTLKEKIAEKRKLTFALGARLSGRLSSGPGTDRQFKV